MRKGIFYSVAAHGHVNPSLEIVRGLCEAGDEIIYYTTVEFEKAVRAVGARYVPYVGIPESREIPIHYLENFFRLGQAVCEFTRDALPRLVDEARAEKADYVIHDSMALWGWVIARVLKIPAIASVPTFVVGGKGIPTEFNAFLQAVGMALHRPDSVWKLHQLGKKIARDYQIEAPSVVESLCCLEPLNICYTVDSLQPPIGDKSNFRFIGPSVRKDQGPPVALPEDKIVFVSLGTINNRDLGFYTACFEAFEDFDATIVMAVGEEKDRLPNPPKNFVLDSYFPQTQILKKAQAFVTHCGMNSVHEALYEGVPLVLCPRTPEQRTVAAQVNQAGAGFYIKEKPIAARRLREGVEKVLREEKYRNAALRLQKEMRAAGGPSVGVQSILSYLSSHCQSIAH